MGNESTAIQKSANAGEVLVRHPLPALKFSAEQRKMIRDSFANGASDAEFEVLMAVASARGLNPLLKQIYFVKRYDSQKRCDVWSTQVSIDGLRVIADRTGLYAGQDEPEWVEENGAIRLCKVRVYRKDWTRPAVGVAYWSEYVQLTKENRPTHMWATKAHLMIAKCAEGLALRKAFPEQLSGLYAPEEFGRTDTEVEGTGVVVETPVKSATAPSTGSRAADARDAPVQDTPALDALCRDLAEIEGATLLDAARVWKKHCQAVYTEAAGDARYLHEAQRAVLGVTRVGCTHNQLNEHVAALEARERTPRDTTYADVMDLLALADSAEDVVETWRTNKAAIELRSEELRLLLRKLATRRVQELMPGMSDAKQAAQWLKNALSKEPEPPNGGGAPKPEMSPANDVGDVEREAIAAEGDGASSAVAMSPADTLRAKLAECTAPDHLYNALFKHGPALGLSEHEGMAIAKERLVQLGKSEMTATNMVRGEISKRGWKPARHKRKAA